MNATLTADLCRAAGWADHVRDVVFVGHPAVQSVADLLRDAVRNGRVEEVRTWMRELRTLCVSTEVRAALDQLERVVGNAVSNCVA